MTLPEDSLSPMIPEFVQHTVWQFAPFPLTLTLSLGEREQRASRSERPTGLDCTPVRAGFTLSRRERAGVAGKKPLRCEANILRLSVGLSIGSPKLQRSAKSQTPMPRHSAGGGWSLRLLWNVELGTWSFMFRSHFGS